MELDPPQKYVCEYKRNNKKMNLTKSLSAQVSLSNVLQKGDLNSLQCTIEQLALDTYAGKQLS